MKTKNKQIEKSTIETLREIRDKVSDETQNMTFEQLQDYIQQKLKETIHPNASWHQ
ncbi:MAG: hypothetical protein WCL51_06100 [Bacteroidota bacterium]